MTNFLIVQSWLRRTSFIAGQAFYPPEADFVIRSARHPETEIRDWRQFEAIRRRYDEARGLPSPNRGWRPVGE